MTPYRYLPTINSLLPYDRLDSLKLGILREAFEPLLAHLFYKNLFIAGTPDGSAGHYDLTLVWYKRLALEVPGTDGLALVAFPAQDGGTGMELPIGFDYRWEILRYKPYFDGTIPADPRAWFDLLMDILGVDPQALLTETIAILVEGDEPLQTFVETSGKGLLTLSDDPDADVYADLFQQFIALNMDLAQIVYDDYIAPASDKLERITALFSAWLGAIDPSELLALVIPQFELELRRIQFALTFPRTWLKPLDENGSIIADPTHRSALTFDVGKFRISSKEGLIFQQQGNFNFPKSVILDTGFTLSLKNALVDISQTDNIAPADADGRPMEFIGFYAQDAAVGLPPDWFEDPDGTTAELFGSDVLVGTGGVSGTFGIRAAAPAYDDPVLNFRLGGADGIAVGLRHFNMHLHKNRLELAELKGQISIPGINDDSGRPAALDMSATLDDIGALHIETTGQMHLGNGIWLYPSDSRPILSATIEKGALTATTFDVHALFKAPHGDEADGTRNIEVSGSLTLLQGADGAWRIERFNAVSQATDLSWTLPGNLEIAEARFSIELKRDGTNAAGQFIAGASGQIELESADKVAMAATLAFNNTDDPTDITFQGIAQPTHVNLFDQLYLFDASFALGGTTKPSPSGELSVAGSAGLFSTGDLPPMPAPENFHLHVDGLDGRFAFHPSGFELIVRSGILHLPDHFGPDPDNPASPRPTVSLNESQPLTLGYSAPDQVRFEGRFTFTDIGATLPGTQDQTSFMIKLETADLIFTDQSLPQLSGVNGFIRLPLPDNQTADVGFEDIAWALTDIPTGTIFLKDDIPLPLGAGFEMAILGSADPAQGASSLTLSRKNGMPRLQIDGKLRMTVPADLLTGESGDQISGIAAMQLDLAQDGTGSLTLKALAIESNVRFDGPQGIHIQEGILKIADMSIQLGDNRISPPEISIVGKMVLPEHNEYVSIEGRYMDNLFFLRSSARLHLGNGIWLLPSGDRPVLDLAHQTAGDFKFSVDALFKAPHAEGGDGTKEIQVSGTLELKTGATGAHEIHVFEASSEATGCDWTLPGNIQLCQAVVSVRYSRSTRTFEALLQGLFSPDQGHGMIDFEAGLIFNDLQDPANIEIQARIDIENLTMVDQAHVFDAALALEVTTKPLFGKLEILSGTAGLFPKVQPADSVNDLGLAITDLKTQLSFRPQGFDLVFESGTLHLPENFGPDPDKPDSPRPTVSLSESQPLRLNFTAPDQARFEGRFTFTDFGATLPGTNSQAGFEIKLETADLIFTDQSLPQLSDVNGFIRLPLPDNQTADVGFEDIAWALIDMPTGTIFLKEDIPLPLGGGFELAILGSENPADDRSSLALSKANGKPRLLIDGTARLIVPADFLTGESGDQISGIAAVQLDLAHDGTGSLTLKALAIESDLHIGGPQGIHIQEGMLKIADLAIQLGDSRISPPEISIAGKMALPENNQYVAIEGWYKDNLFFLRSSAMLNLGNGIWLLPDADRPVLELAHQTAGEFKFSVDALFKAPHADGGDGTKEIRVSGTLELKTGAAGALEVHAFEASSEAAGFDWTLPGNIQLRKAGVSILYARSTNTFKALLRGRFSPDQGHGSIDIEAGLIFNDLQDPANIEIQARLDIENLAMVDQAHVFDAALTLEVTTKPLFGKLQILSGTAGLFPKVQPADSVNDFGLAITDLKAQLSFRPQGFDLVFESGALQLPANFGPDPDNPDSPHPTVSLDETNPLTVIYRTPDQVRFQGQFIFTDFGTTLPGTKDRSDLVIKLQTATLTFSDHTLPQLAQVAGFIRLPLPDDRTADVVFEDFAWALIDIPTGIIYLKEDIPLPLGGGFEFQILGSENPTDIATGLTIAKDNGRPVFLIDGAVRLAIPADMLTGEDGDQLFAEVAGNLLINLDELSKFTLEEVALGGNFCLGGANGIKIEDGQIAVEGIENLFRQSPGHPFVMTLSGEIGLPDQGIGFGLEGAKFSFVGEPLPHFDLEGISVEPGAALQAIEQLPLKVYGAELEFVESRPLPAKLAPDNIKLTISAGLEFPIPPDATFMGRVDDLSVWFDANGLPHMELSGLGLGIEDVKAGPLNLTGMVYLGGLNDPQNDLFFAGKVGGKLNNTGVVALAAFGTKGPLGVCLDVSAGPAGIPLGTTGFLLTGVAGGVSFINSNADPCDITSYIQIGDDGRPLDHPPSPPPQEARGPADDPVVTEPALLPEDTDSLEIPCPTADCPPPAMNILCQPHPDSAAYPDRVIIKYSALDEAFLNQIGITPERIESLGLTSPQDIAASIAEEIRNGIEALWPPVPPGLGDLDRMAADHLDNLESILQAMIAEAAAAAINGNASVYEAICEAAYAGVPCPDITVKLTGTFSYTGISTFLSVTGGFTLSSTGTAGLLGAVNLLGIPVGQARGFATAFDPEGNPDLSICGDIKVALGPLELGLLRFVYQCPGCITDIAGAVGKFGQHLAGPFISETVDLVAKEVKDHPHFDPAKPETALNLLAPEQAVAFVAQLLSLPPGKLLPEDLTACLRSLFNDTWQSFEPEILMCGQANPKLFGLPIGGELVSVSAMATKTEMAASFGFSPSYMILNLFWAVATGGQGLSYPLFPAMDKASMGFGIKLPDPLELIERGLTGHFQTPQDLVAFMEEGFEYVLQNATYTVDYELSPFGLKLADAEARVIMPNLLDHPAHPQSTWKRPEDRGQNYPSRIDVATAALKQNVLGNPLWRGTSADLADLVFPDDKTTRGLSLVDDYFPHGGLLGAGWLALPKALLDAPPIDLFEKIFDAEADIFARLEAGVEYIQDYILTTEDVGAFTFYLPGLNPPAFTVNGRDLTPMELMKLIHKQELDVGGIAGSDLYSFEQAFLQGFMETRLLGIPIGHSQVVAIPPDVQTDTEGCFEIRAEIPAGSWLKEFVDQANLVFELRQAPPEPVDQHFQVLKTVLETHETDENNLLSQFFEDLRDQMPKVALIATLEGFTIPAGLDLILGIGGNIRAELHAYSPLYDYNPAFKKGDPVATARNNGGIAIVLDGNLALGQQFGFKIVAANAALGIFPGPAGFPALQGAFKAARVELPFGLPDLIDASIEFNSESAQNKPLVPSGGFEISGTVQGNPATIRLENRSGELKMCGLLNLSIAIKGSIGPIHEPVSKAKLVDRILIDADFKARFFLSLGIADGYVQITNGQITWNGINCKVPPIKLSTSAISPQQLAGAVLAHIQNNAFLVFSYTLKSPQRWLDAMGSGAIQLTDQGIHAIAKGLKALNQPLGAAAKSLAGFGFSVEQVIDGLYQQYTQNIATLLATLRPAGFTNSQQIANAMQALFQGQYAAQLAKWFHDTWGWRDPLRTIADRFFRASFSAVDTAKSLASLPGATMESVAGALRTARFSVEQVAQGIKSAFAPIINDAAQALKTAGFSAVDVAKGIEGVFTTSANVTAAALKAAGFAAADVGRGLKSAFTITTNTAAAVLKAAGFAAADVGKGLRSAYTSSTNTAAAALKAAGFAAADVGKGLRNAYTSSTNSAAAALRAAGFSAVDVGKGLRNAYTSSTNSAAAALRAAGFSAVDVGKGLKSAYNSSTHAAAAALKAAGFAAADVGKGLRSAFTKNANTAAKALKATGFSVTDIGKGLRSAYTSSTSTATAALRAAGFAAYDVGKGIKNTFTTNTTTAAKALKSAGFAAADVGKGLKYTFTTSTNTAAAALKAAGFAAADVGKGIKTTFTTSATTAAKALKSAGFAAINVGKGLKYTFTTSTNTAASALKSAGFAAADVGKGIKGTFTTSTTTAAKALKSAGFAVSDVGKDLKNTFTTSTTTAAKALKGAGYSAYSVCKSLHSNFSKTMSTVAKAMYAAKIDYSSTLDAIVKVFKSSVATVTGVLLKIF